MPRDIKIAFQKAQQRLRPLGFQFHHYQTKIDQPITWICVFFHPEHNTYATIWSTFCPRQQPYSIIFNSFDSSRTCVSTVNGIIHTFRHSTPNLYIYDLYTPYLDVQWQAHLRALVEHNLQPQRFSDKEFIQRIETTDQRYLNSAYEAGWLKPIGDNEYRLKWPYAIRFALQVSTGERKAIKYANHYTLESENKELIQADVEAFKTFFERRRNRINWPIKLAIAICIIIGIHLLDSLLPKSFQWSWQNIALLIPILLLHDLILLMGLRQIGYRYPTDFYLPFLPKALLSTAACPYPLIEAFWLLIAALSGLLIGYVYFYFADLSQPINSMFVLLCLTVSYGNLLPAIPFAGGRILNLLLFNRYPYAQLLILFAIMLALQYLAIGYISSISLAVLIILGFLPYILERWHTTLLLVRLRKELDDQKHVLQTQQVDILTNIFKLLKTTLLKDKDSRVSFRIAKELLARAPLTAAADMPALLILVSYFLTFLLPLANLAGLFDFSPKCSTGC